MQNAAGSYNDADTGKHGFSGVAADGQKAFKNYQVRRLSDLELPVSLLTARLTVAKRDTLLVVGYKFSAEYNLQGCSHSCPAGDFKFIYCVI